MQELMTGEVSILLLGYWDQYQALHTDNWMSTFDGVRLDRAAVRPYLK